jgi:chemotaxis protein methyltransferase CheR
VSDEKISQFFEVDGKQARPRAKIRDAVEFHYLNLAEDTYPSLATGIWNMDIILCRNVLIYLDEATVKKVASRLLEALSPDGWLFLGGADPLLGNLVRCEVITTDSGLAYRRNEAGRQAPPPRRVEPAPPAPVPVTPILDEAIPAPTTASVEPAHAAADPGGVISEIRGLANSGDIERATRLCDRSLEAFRASAELFYLQSVLLAETGQHEAAAQAARRALYLDRDLIVAHLALGNSLARSGDMRGAKVALENACRLLGHLPPDALVPASDGELAGRLITMTRMQLRLSEGAA